MPFTIEYGSNDFRTVCKAVRERAWALRQRLTKESGPDSEYTELNMLESLMKREFPICWSAYTEDVEEQRDREGLALQRFRWLTK